MLAKSAYLAPVVAKFMCGTLALKKMIQICILADVVSFGCRQKCRSKANICIILSNWLATMRCQTQMVKELLYSHPLFLTPAKTHTDFFSLTAHMQTHTHISYSLMFLIYKPQLTSLCLSLYYTHRYNHSYICPEWVEAPEWPLQLAHCVLVLSLQPCISAVSQIITLDPPSQA